MSTPDAKACNTSPTGRPTSRRSTTGPIALGYKVAQQGSIGGEQGRFAYLDTEHDQGTVIEISDISGPKGQFFSYISEAAVDWDGSDPIREIG